MTMKRTILVGALLFALPIAGVWLATRGRSEFILASATAQGPAAFAIESQVTKHCTGISGTGTEHVADQVLAQRRDGSAVERFGAVGKPAAATRYVWRTDVRIKGSLNDRLGIRTLLDVADTPGALFAGRLDPAKGCRYYYSGEKAEAPIVAQGAEILGYATVMMVHDRGLVRTTSWNAPALGCFPIRFMLEDRADEKAPWKIASVTEARRVTLGEPDPALFDLRPDYPHLSKVDYVLREKLAHHRLANEAQADPALREKFAQLRATGAHLVRRVPQGERLRLH